MKILCISAHPDDETLGCGGALLKHAAEGHDLFWLIATRVHEPQWSRETIEAKEKEISAVAGAYRLKDVRRLGYETTKLDAVPRGELINGIHEAIADVRPQLVYLVHGGDIHTDHRSVFSAAMSALKPFHMGKLGVKKIVSYETLSSTDAASAGAGDFFVPNSFQDITAYLDGKLAVMGLYKTEIQAGPLPRGVSAIRALARCRGATIGVEYAEAFMLIREIV